MEDLNSRMPSLTDAEFNDLVKIIYDKTRIQMSEHKRALVNSRIIKRLRSLNMSSFKESKWLFICEILFLLYLDFKNENLSFKVSRKCSREFESFNLYVVRI